MSAETTATTVPPSSPEELKQQGNTYFAKGETALALECYTAAIAALDQVVKDSSQDAAAAGNSNVVLRLSLFTNQAACYLKLGEFRKSIEAADSAMEVMKESSSSESSSNSVVVNALAAKALFRRAQAKIGLEELPAALNDARLLLKAFPDAKAAATQLIQTIMEKEGSTRKKQLTSQTPSQKIILSAVNPDISPKERFNLVRQLLSLLADEKDDGLTSKLAKEMAVVSDKLWELCAKEPLALGVLSQVATASPNLVMQANPNYISVLREYALAPPESTFEERAQTSAIITLLRIVDGGKSATKISEFSDEGQDGASKNGGEKPKSNRGRKRRDEQEMTRLAEALWGEPNIPAIKVFVDCLEHYRSLPREAAVEACATYCSATQKHARAFVENNGMEHLLTLSAHRPQLSSIIMSKILPALKNDEEVQKHALAMTSRLLSPLPYQDQHAIDKTFASASALLALLTANQELGMWVVEQDDQKILKELATVHAKDGPDKVVAIVAEIFCQIANTEKGRGLLSETASPTLQLLIHSSNQNVRSAASVALTKMNAVKFDSSSEQGTIVLGAVATLLGKEAKEEEIKRGVEALDYVIQDVDVKGLLTAEGDGIKILQKLCELAARDDSAKTAFAYGLAYLFANITMDSDEARKEKLREMDISEEQYEQFEELTKSKTRVGRKDTTEEIASRVDAFIRADGIKALRALVVHGASERVCVMAAKAFSNCAAQQRVRGTMIAQGAIGALMKIILVLRSSSGEESDSSTASRRELALTTKSKDAVHALAKLLITTDPRLLSESQIMDSVSPLIDQIKNSDDQLVLFECLMALTNIGSLSWEAKERIVKSKGIPPIEYAQFSDNLMVRRAATEAIVNIAQMNETVEWIAQPDKCRLWLLLAEDWEQDMETSRAACALFANISSDPRITATLRLPEIAHKETGDLGVARLARIARDAPFDEIRHRACAAIAEIAASDDPTVKSQGEELALIIETLKTVAQGGGTITIENEEEGNFSKEGSQAVEFAKMALEKMFQ